MPSLSLDKFSERVGYGKDCITKNMKENFKKYFSSNTNNGLETIKFEDEQIPINIHKDIIGIEVFGARTHYHSAYEILYCIDGCADVVCNNNHIMLTENHALFISPYLMHSISTSEESSRCTYYCFLIDRQYLNTAIKLDDSAFYSITENEKILSDLSEVIVEYRKKKQRYVDICRGFLTTCFARLFRTENIVVSSNLKYDTMFKITEYIEKNYSNKINLNDICELTSFSPSRLCTIFKQATGTTISNYINQIRCKHAYQMISSGKYNISESASSCGFNSFSYFSKTYSDFFGELPSDTKRNTMSSE